MDEYGSSLTRQSVVEHKVVSWDGNAVTVFGKDVCGNYHWPRAVKIQVDGFPFGP